MDNIDPAKTQPDNFYREGCTWSLVHDADMVSARKRRQKGQGPLEEQRPENKKDITQERVFVTEPGHEVRETWERLCWQPMDSG